MGKQNFVILCELTDTMASPPLSGTNPVTPNGDYVRNELLDYNADHDAPFTRTKLDQRLNRHPPKCGCLRIQTGRFREQGLKNRSAKNPVVP